MAAKNEGPSCLCTILPKIGCFHNWHPGRAPILSSLCRGSFVTGIAKCNFSILSANSEKSKNATASCVISLPCGKGNQVGNGPDGSANHPTRGARLDAALCHGWRGARGARQGTALHSDLRNNWCHKAPCCIRCHQRYDQRPQHSDSTSWFGSVHDPSRFARSSIQSDATA